MAEKRGRGNTGDIGSVTELSNKTIQGRAAQELLDNKTLNQALDDMRNSAFVLIENSTMDEQEKRENLYSFIKAINKLRQQLDIYVNKGKGAGIKLEKIING
jgi:3-phosphoglycerate kinase